MDVTDPLRTLENDESDDLFKSAFNGSAGVIKITSKHESDSQEGKNGYFLKKWSFHINYLYRKV